MKGLNSLKAHELTPAHGAAPGPLLVACPSMMAGYWGESASGLREGYWDTGDLARIDASGNLTITGRAKLMIDIGGKKVNPVEVENVLLEHPDVGDACVVPLRLTPTLCRLRAVINTMQVFDPLALQSRGLRVI